MTDNELKVSQQNLRTLAETIRDRFALDPNTPQTRSAVVRQLWDILTAFDYEPEKYQMPIRCDQTNNPREAVNTGQLIFQIGPDTVTIKPYRIDIQCGQRPYNLQMGFELQYMCLEKNNNDENTD